MKGAPPVKLRLFAVFSVLSFAVAALAAFAGTAGARSNGGSLTGAGSTFVAPLVNSWVNYFGPKAGVSITYGAVGSGAGIAAITSKTVDFGTSDAPLSPAQKQACGDCVQIPWAVSSTAFDYNLPGVTKQLRVTGRVLADIYMGKVTAWNDPEIAKLNPGVKLPSTRITPVYRSDGSGTSYNVTDYLSEVSPAFASRVGKSTQPPFTVGTGARGSSGVAGAVKSTEGAIGYTDVAYALQNKLRFFALQNAAGNYETPGIKATVAAANTVKSVPADNAISIVNPAKSAKDAYPCATFTYIIVRPNSPDRQLLKQWILFAVSPTGQKLGQPLVFAPLPRAVAVAANKTIAKL
jgi:phosphate transport system substrate-binding protein